MDWGLTDKKAKRVVPLILGIVAAAVARRENIADQTNKHYIGSARNHQGRARLAFST